MSNYKTDSNYLKAREEEKVLSDRVKSLIPLVERAYEKDRKVSLLRELALAISSFDDHLKKLIKDFPIYYQEFTPYLDRVLKENSNFLHVCLEEIDYYNNPVKDTKDSKDTKKQLSN